MNKKIARVFPLIIFSSLIFLFFSCSQVAPELTQANYSVIFEYDEEFETPASRLSIFVESNTDVRRYDRIKITSLDTGYIWDFTEISKMKYEDAEWAGNTNLVVPENEVIPCGNYEVTYYNSDEKETTIYVTVSYDTDFYDVSYEEVPEVISKKNGFCKIAIYNEDKAMLYFGNKIAEYSTPRGIWNNFRDAAYYQDIYYTPGNFEICIMPEKKVALEE